MLKNKKFLIGGAAAVIALGGTALISTTGVLGGIQSSVTAPNSVAATQVQFVQQTTTDLAATTLTGTPVTSSATGATNVDMGGLLPPIQDGGASTTYYRVLNNATGANAGTFTTALTFTNYTVLDANGNNITGTPAANAFLAGINVTITSQDSVTLTPKTEVTSQTLDSLITAPTVLLNPAGTPLNTAVNDSVVVEVATVMPTADPAWGGYTVSGDLVTTVQPV